jgi:hypothetical protein
MSYIRLFLLTVLAGTAISCSKSDSNSTPTPIEEDLTTPVAGIYKLTKVTPKSGGLTVTGVGSMTIVAVDKTTTRITQVRSFTNTATGAPSLFTNTDESNKVAKDGSSFIIKTPTGTAWATINGGKISTSDIISTAVTTTVTLDTEYTKQ